MINILYDDRQEFVKIDTEILKYIDRSINAVYELMLDKEKDYEVSVSFVNAEEIKVLNRDFRNNDSVTDVLSFPLDESVMNMVFLGDVVINTERVIEQSKDLGHSIEREFMYLTVHSILHLLGYDHEIDSDKKLMRAKEKEIMNILGVFKNEK